jgi:YHS domain-containing protein
MTFIVRMLRYLFWIVVVSWVVRLLGRLVSRMGSGASEPRPNSDVPSDAVSKKLVRDPVCGIHVSEGLALPLQQGTETIYFCSAECRNKYVDGEKQFAANA